MKGGRILWGLLGISILVNVLLVLGVSNFSKASVESIQYAEETKNIQKTVKTERIEAVNLDIEAIRTECDRMVRPESYQIFYGEWEATGHVVVERIPVRGVNYSDEEYVNFVARREEAVIGRRIQFTRDMVVIDDDRVIEDVWYSVRLFPADDGYFIHFTTRLYDLGLILQL